MKNIDREVVYKTAKIIAGHRGVKCNGNTCANCDHDCICLEIAHQVIALGYNQTKSHVKNNIMKSAPFQGMVEELAKSIASSRGYGCSNHNCCFRCICYGDCIPHNIATSLIKNGYRKERV